MTIKQFAQLRGLISILSIVGLALLALSQYGLTKEVKSYFCAIPLGLIFAFILKIYGRKNYNLHDGDISEAGTDGLLFRLSVLIMLAVLAFGVSAILVLPSIEGVGGATLIIEAAYFGSAVADLIKLKNDK